MYNSSDNDIDISGFFIGDKKMLEKSPPEYNTIGLINGKLTSILIEAKGFLKLEKDTPGHFDFGISKDEETIELLDTNNNLIDIVSYNLDKDMCENASWGRFPAGSDNF